MTRGASLVLIIGSIVIAVEGGLPQLSGSSSHGSFVVDGNTPWVVETFPVPSLSLAIRDVRKDWYSVFSLPPNILPDMEALGSYRGAVVLLGRIEFVKKIMGSEYPSVMGDTLDKVEAHACRDWSRGVVCTGNGDLGAIYGAYLFSHKILQVDPAEYWTERSPPRTKSLVVPRPLSHVVGSPLFETRGWFINDEDLLTGFRRDPLGANPMTLELADAVFSTILRHGGNAVIPGTATFPDEDIVDLASRRGLVIAQYPTGLTYSYYVNPAMQEYAWGLCVDSLKNKKMAWSVGYRGLNDYPFWNDDPSFDTDAKREVMAKQMEIISTHTGDESPRAFTFLWDEMSDLYAKKTLKVPDGVTKVFADAGNGIINDKDLLSEGDGLYYHVAMESGNHNQLTEMVPPSRVYSEIGHMVRRNATSAIILNTSDVRPVIMSMTAVMEYVWDPSPYLEDPGAAQTKFLSRWADSKFGRCGGNLVADISEFWNKYYSLSFITNLKGEQYISGRIRALGGALADYARKKSTSVPVDDAEKDIQFFGDSFKSARALHDFALQIRHDVESRCPEELGYFHNHVLHHIDTVTHALNALESMIAAVKSYKSIPQSLAAVKESAISMESLVSAYRNNSDHSRRFGEWYMNDELTNFFNVMDVVNDAVSAMTGDHDGEPLVRFFRFGNGVWSTWYAYENKTNPYAPHNYPLFHYEPKNMQAAVRVLCDGSCKQTPTGGSVSGPYRVTLHAPSDGAIRYTTDGSQPTPSSALYTDAISMAQPSTIAARIFSKAGVASEVPASIAEFRKSG